MVISPWLLRPPERFFGSSERFSGVCLVTSLLSSMVMKRRDAVYGLKLFSAIVCLYLSQTSAPPWRSPNCSQVYSFSAYSIIFSPAASLTYAFFQSRR